MSSSAARNLLTGGALLSACGAIYLYTMYHLKRSAPGDLERMVPLPPSDEARQRLEDSKGSNSAATK